MPRLAPPDLLDANEGLAGASAEAVIAWAVERFGERLAVTSSFQTQSLPLLHLIAQTAPQIPVWFLDTGFHFPETLAFRDRVVEQLGLNLVVLRAETGGSPLARAHGQLYRTDPDRCCFIHKVEPLEQALTGVDAYLTGIRRDQTATRRLAQAVQWDARGAYKLCPMLDWTSRDVWQYIHDHGLPEHPLVSTGYLSIGCAPCTAPVTAGQSEREGRWSGQSKVECGLHVAEPSASSVSPSDSSAS
jgi:phosphoadenosine phosphosulfate reductase